MKALLENFAAILGAATIALLLMSVCHEYGYFLAIGHHLQTILTTTDYFSNAVLWLPIMIVTAYGMLDWNLMLEKKTLPMLGLNWATLFWGLLIFVWPICYLLFLPFNGYIPIVMGLIFFWLMYGYRIVPAKEDAPQSFNIVRRAVVIGPVIALLFFGYGFSHGREDLSTFDNPYDVKLKGGEYVHRILLRTLDKGVIMRDPVKNVIEFLRWDDISMLSHRSTLDKRSLACRWFGFLCKSAITP